MKIFHQESPINEADLIADVDIRDADRVIALAREYDQFEEAHGSAMVTAPKTFFSERHKAHMTAIHEAAKQREFGEKQRHAHQLAASRLGSCALRLYRWRDPAYRLDPIEAFAEASPGMAAA